MCSDSIKVNVIVSRPIGLGGGRPAVRGVAREPAPSEAAREGGESLYPVSSD